jgi:ribonuclease HI
MQRSILSYFTQPQPGPLPQTNPKPPPTNILRMDDFITTASYPTAEPDITPPGAELDTPYMDIFCDGACFNNGRRGARAGMGLYVKVNGADHTSVSEALERSEPQTNQRAELRALERALEFAAEASDMTVRIFTDSEYSINCITKWAYDWREHNWCRANHKVVQHQDIISHANALWDTVKDRTTIEHVKAHTNRRDWKSLGNAKADHYATASISKGGR